MVAAVVSSAVFFLLTVVGYAIQLRKLVARHRLFLAGALPRDAVCQGLLPFREFVSYLAFLLFALSGATRSYFDLVLVGTRVPVLILATLILFMLALYGMRQAQPFFYSAVLGLVLFLIVVIGIGFGFDVRATALPGIVDRTLVVVSGLLVWGKVSQGWLMYRTGKAGGVSVSRELGLVCKDLTGLWYASTVGEELWWIGATHLMSAASSAFICVAKLRARS